MSRRTDQELLTDFNRVAALYLRNLDADEADQLIRMFERGDVIIGADSMCFHICPIDRVKLEGVVGGGYVPVDNVSTFIGRADVATDCNPWLADEMAKGRYATEAEVPDLDDLPVREGVASIRCQGCGADFRIKSVCCSDRVSVSGRRVNGYCKDCCPNRLRGDHRHGLG